MSTRMSAVAAFSAFMSVAPAFAQSSEISQRYFDVLEMEQVFDILREEGMEGGREIARDDEALSLSPAWDARLDRIYDTDRARNLFDEGLNIGGDPAAAQKALDFFETDLGSKIVDLELTARRAMANDEVIEALESRIEMLADEAPERLALYHEFIEANDLVDSNVAGALNSNLAFYRGMATQPQFQGALDETFMLSTVWEQEPDIRADTEDWTISFATLAYESLTEEEMTQYLDVSRSVEGQKLNAALFSGFNTLLETQSFELGRAMAEFSTGEDT